MKNTIASTLPRQFVTAAVPEHMQSISEICLGQCGVERKAGSKVLEQSELHQCHQQVTAALFVEAGSVQLCAHIHAGIKELKQRRFPD